MRRRSASAPSSPAIPVAVLRAWTVGLALDLLLRYDADVSMQPFSEHDADDLRRPLMRNVRIEGVEL